jgi:hemerythrin-like domain-containing protein
MDPEVIEMAVQIGAKPDAGFDDPLGMLTDCHRRIENFLRVLCHLAETEPEGTLTTDECNAAQTALEYFRTGGPKHMEDEEKSLFPRVHAAGAADSLDALARLEAEHREASELHSIVERLFSNWIANRSLAMTDRDALFAAANRLKGLYSEHIQLEEEVVFPRAEQCLSREALAAIGAEFRARRSVPDINRH